MQFVLFLTFPMIFGVLAISKDFSIVFLGEGFEKSGDLIRLLSITILFLSWGTVIRNQYLIPKSRDKEYIISAFMGAIVNFVMNCIFIPKYGSIGACIGTIMAEFIVAFYQSWVVRKELPILSYIKDSMSFLLKGIVMFIFVLLVGKVFEEDIVLKIFLQVLTGIIVYAVLNIKYIFNDLEVGKIFKGKVDFS